MGKPLGSFYGLRKHPSKNVGHLAYSVRPMRWCVQLEEDDLHMLVILEAFNDYAKGRPSPQASGDRLRRGLPMESACLSLQHGQQCQE